MEPNKHEFATDLTTSTSLLRRLGGEQPDGKAWESFDAFCRRRVKKICSGLSQVDKDDIAQKVSLRVYENIGEFQRQRKGSFRKWLRRIISNVTVDYFREQDRIPQATQDEILQRIAAPTAEDQNEEEQEIYDCGCQVMERDFCPEWVRAFKGMVFENKTAVEMGKELGMTPENIRQAKFKVLQRLKEELAWVLEE